VIPSLVAFQTLRGENIFSLSDLLFVATAGGSTCKLSAFPAARIDIPSPNEHRWEAAREPQMKQRRRRHQSKPCSGAQLDPSRFTALDQRAAYREMPRFGISPWQRRQPLLQGRRYLPTANGVERGITTLTTLRGAPSMLNMQHLVQIACAAALISASSYSYAAQNGINYDPAHSRAYKDAQADYNGPRGVAGMTDAINADLMQIKNTLKFNTIKTYFSQYCNIPTGQCVPSIAQLANAVGLKVMLGVREFPDHPDWTQGQVQAAIAAAKDASYGKAVIGIVVGNEDMFNSQGIPNETLQRRIVEDIKTIKAAGISVPVTTAQRQGDWCGGMDSGCDPKRSPNNNPPNPSLNQEDKYGVLTTVDAIGANIFPYWGGSAEKVKGVSVASVTQATAMDLLTALTKNGVKGVIVTEEGWPSCAAPSQNAATINDEIDYFRTWSNHANQSFDSYYFQTYDLTEQIACGNTDPSGDADKHFGLCAEAGATKDARLIVCK
jgi:exo-beta-1,3-glucanase (GH17 family)